MNPPTQRYLRVSGLVAGFALILTGCAAPEEPEVQSPDEPDIVEPPEAPDPVRLSYLRGSSAIAVVVMQRLSLPEKYNLDVEWLEFVEVEALNSATAVGQDDIALALSVENLVTFRSAGRDIVAVYSGLRNPVSIIVSEDSDIEGLCDLAGRRVAVSDADDPIMAYFLQRDCELDLHADIIAVPGPPPVVGTFLGDEAEAVRNFEPFQTMLLLQGDTREIWRADQAWEEAFGQPLLVTTISAQGGFARENPDVVRRVIAMYQEAVEYTRANPDEVLAAYGDYIGLDDETLLERLADRQLPALMTQWDDPMLAALAELTQIILEASGEMQEPEPGLFSQDYVP